MIKNWLQLKIIAVLLAFAVNSQAAADALSWDKSSKPSRRLVPGSLPTLPDFLKGLDPSTLEYDPVRGMYYISKNADSTTRDEEKGSATTQTGSKKK